MKKISFYLVAFFIFFIETPCFAWTQYDYQATQNGLANLRSALQEMEDRKWEEDFEKGRLLFRQMNDVYLPASGVAKMAANGEIPGFKKVNNAMKQGFIHEKYLRIADIVTLEMNDWYNKGTCHPLVSDPYANDVPILSLSPSDFTRAYDRDLKKALDAYYPNYKTLYAVAGKRIDQTRAEIQQRYINDRSNDTAISHHISTENSDGPFEVFSSFDE